MGYIYLRSLFDEISAVLLSKFEQFEHQGFAPSRAHTYSMSFGSQLALDAGKNFGGKIDSLDGKCK